MSPVQLATLDNVAPSAAWPHEARDFTPWLAANLDRLSAVVGLPLELVDTEVSVGPFRADIVALNTADGSTVLIENQLYGGDHNHLGQVLTYLAGVKAHTVIWVASHFRAEHLSAINWLNEHTVEPYSFLAVKVRVVRIGDSPYAPLFEVVERPSDWDRAVSAASESVKEASPQAERRRRFFEEYVQRFPAASSDRSGGGGASRWRQVAGKDLQVARWMTGDNVGVFVRGSYGRGGKIVRPLLSQFEEVLERALGVPLGEDLDYPFIKYGPHKVTEPSSWPAAIDWLEAETQRYVEALTQLDEGFFAPGAGPGDHG